jgi:hypothetical protein
LKGDQGATGAPGPQGERGEAGAQGATGPQGPQGLVGPQGETGPQGLKGETGATGAAGAPGATGGTGPTGPAGAKGEKGDKGDTGDQGPAGAAGSAGANGGSVTIADAPAINCPNGGVAVTDAAQHTQFVCDGRTGAQGPRGATGTSVVLAESWLNTNSTYSAPFITCCTTATVNGAAATIPGSRFTATTTGGRLLIQAMIPLTIASGARLFCQPNIDNSWAGPGAALYDYVQQLNTPGMTTVMISRTYPEPAPGTHEFSLACGQQGGGLLQLMANTVISFTVMELR